MLLKLLFSSKSTVISGVVFTCLQTYIRSNDDKTIISTEITKIINESHLSCLFLNKENKIKSNPTAGAALLVEANRPGNCSVGDFFRILFFTELMNPTASVRLRTNIKQTNTYTHKHTHTHARAHTHTHTKHTHTHAHTHTHTLTHIHKHVHAHAQLQR